MAHVAPTVTLVFDTFQQARPPGIRSATFGSRHLLYRIDHLTADLRLESSTQAERLLLIGQIADARRLGRLPAPVRVAVVSGTDELLAVETNELGEFQCEFGLRHGLALSMALHEHVVIPLDRLPAPSTPHARPLPARS